MTKKINTTPIYPRPRQEQINEAKYYARRIKEWVIPKCLIMDDVLVRFVLAEGHSTASALWAIHELCSEGEFKVFSMDEIPEKKERWELVSDGRRPAGLMLADGVLHYGDIHGGKSDWGFLCFEPVQNKSPEDSSRPCFDRDHTMLEWYEQKGSGTYRSPTKIRNRWNSEHPDEKIGSKADGVDVVKKAIKNAKSDLENVTK